MDESDVPVKNYEGQHLKDTRPKSVEKEHTVAKTAR